MKIIFSDIGNLISNALKHCKYLKVVVAYYSPDKKLETLLSNVHNLQIIVSDDFSINNPYSLELLEKKGGIVRYLPSDNSCGKLHSKVYFGQKNNGSNFLIISSANLTYKGFFSNCETSVVFDSKNEKFESKITEFNIWFNKLLNSSEKIDYSFTKKIFDKSKNHHSREDKSNDRKFWILKSTAGGDLKKDYWSKFLSENVVALGWGERLSSDPTKEKKEKFINEISTKYPKVKYPSRIYSKIKNFQSIKKNDIVIVIRGYSPNQESNVFLYGFAKVTKSNIPSKNNDWWVYKHRAKISKVETYFPKELFSSTLKKKSLLQAIHKIDKKSYNNLTKELVENYGLKIDY